MTDEEKERLEAEEKAKKEAEEKAKAEAEAEEKAKKEQELQALITDVKAEYEVKLAKQKEDFEKKVKERDKVIKQLLTQDGDANKPKNAIIDDINARRSAQLKKW